MRASPKERQHATTLPRSLRRLFPDVTECFDSDRVADVHVKAVDVRKSNPLHPSQCAMAQAFKRETHAEGAIIGIAYSYLIKGKTAFRFKTPTAVQREIVTFDRHHDFQEGHYYLVPPSPAARLGTKKGSKTSGPSGSNRAQRLIHRTARIRVLEGGAEPGDILIGEGDRATRERWAGARLIKKDGTRVEVHPPTRRSRKR